MVTITFDYQFTDMQISLQANWCKWSVWTHDLRTGWHYVVKTINSIFHLFHLYFFQRDLVVGLPYIVTYANFVWFPKKIMFLFSTFFLKMKDSEKIWKQWDGHWTLAAVAGLCAQLTSVHYFPSFLAIILRLQPACVIQVVSFKAYPVKNVRSQWYHT